MLSKNLANLKWALAYYVFKNVEANNKQIDEPGLVAYIAILAFDNVVAGSDNIDNNIIAKPAVISYG